jgi:serine/threonine protein kinase/Tol biopolymer transport system component
MDPERWQRIESIFNRALDAGTGSRAGVLEEFCAGDEELRREVESLLAQHEKADEFIERPAFARPGDAPPPSRPRYVDSHSAGIPDGTVIGHYRIVGKIGSGGMGVVYEAEDLKLRRHVALKFLPEEVAEDLQSLQRFRVEARAASALNHPNICTIYEVDEVEGHVFVALELLEGQTLKQMISGKPLPVETVLDLGIQIAEAINAAHSKGIVHRDIKPANTFVTTQRRIKILDFGLAKLTQREPNSEEAPLAGETEPGMVMGTVGYMSPEQVRGLAVDGRTDIFAAGAILYEMLAGRRAFEGPTSADTISAILNEEPPAISQLAPSTPPALVRVVKRCLEKNPEERFQSASDLAFALEALSESSGAMTSAGVKHHPPRRIWAPAVLSVALIIVALILWKLVFPPQRAPKVLSFTKLTNDGQPKFGPMVTDGLRIYFTEVFPGQRSIVVQVSVKGGDTAPLIVPLKQPAVLDLSRDGTDLLLANEEEMDLLYQTHSLWLQPVAGGSPRRVGTVLAGSTGFGASAAFGVGGGSVVYAERRDIYSAALDGSSPHKVLTTANDHLSGPFAFRFSPDARTLRFSQDDPEVDSTTIMEAVTDGTRFRKMFAGCCGEWTTDGRFFVFQNKINGKSNLWTLSENRVHWLQNRDEKPTQLTAGPLDFEYPSPSKDGKEIFAVGTSPQEEVVRYDARSGEFVSFLPGVSGEDLAFSPDGQWVVYTSYPDGLLWRSKADGSERLQLTFPPLQATLARWSHDAKQIVFSAKFPDSVYNVYLVPSEGGAPQRILPSQQGQMDVNWSPDGSSLIFASDGVPNAPISLLDLRTKHVSTLPGSNGRFSPHWSPDGRYIAAIQTENQTLMLYDVATQSWQEIFGPLAGYETWSHDGKYIYFEGRTAPDTSFRVFRFRLSDRKIEEVADMRKVGRFGFDQWFGLAPDDSSLVNRDISTQEIYALEMDWP